MNCKISDQNSSIKIALKASSLEKADAFLVGLKFFFLTVGVALATIIIPIAHFITVPLGLLSSPIIGFIVFRNHIGAERISGEFPCLKCSHAVTINTLKPTSEISIRCKNCEHKMNMTQHPTSTVSILDA